MNDNTTKLLQELALKLGTTTEYLWLIVLKQARFSATIELFQTVCIIMFGIVLWKIHKYFSAYEKDCRYNKYHDSEGAVILMALAGLAFTVLAIIAFVNVGDIINGYFNPEYWALHNILDHLTSH